MHSKVLALVESKTFQSFILALIVINGITMGLETSKSVMSSLFGVFIEHFDKIVLTIFTIEILLRIYAHKTSFFKDAWSLFDFVIVAISLMPTSGGFEIFRILRVLRLFRVITVVPQMRKVVTALVSVVPGMFSIAMLMLLVFYIFAIMATGLYAQTFPQWFGDLGKSLYTLFQVMTLESWSMGIVRPVMEQHPYAWVFFIPFIFIATFIMINLIIAIVVDAMGEIQENDNVDDKDMKSEMDALRAEMKELKALLKERKA